MKMKAAQSSFVFAFMSVLAAIPQAGGHHAAAPASHHAGIQAQATQGEKRPQSGQPRLIRRQRNVEDKKLNSKITIAYPELIEVPEGIRKTFNAAILGYIGAETAEFERNLKLLAAEEGFVPGEKGWALDIEYETVFIGRDLLSLRLQAASYTGGAHGLAGVETFNADLKNGRMLALADLFRPDSDWLKVISDRCIAELREMGLSDADWILKGAGPKVENFDSWNITTEGLEFTFGLYQVGPYAIGMPEVILPYPGIRPILRPGGPLAVLFK